MMKTDGTGNGAHTGTVVFDLDGVVYLGDVEIPGAGDALAAVANLGWHIVFATNNSTRTRDDVLRHIEARTGFPAHDADVATSAMAAATWTAREHGTVFVVGEQGLRDTLGEAGLEVVEDDADAVVVGLDRQIDYASIANAARMVRDGATYVATNTDATFPTPDGPVPGAGAIVAAITKAAGRQPITCGKPEDPMVDLVRSFVRGPDIWVVGDRPETDLAMAKRAGWRSALVLTGVTSSNTPMHHSERPTVTLDSIAAVPDVISSHHRPQGPDER